MKQKNKRTNERTNETNGQATEYKDKAKHEHGTCLEYCGISEILGYGILKLVWDIETINHLGYLILPRIYITMRNIAYTLNKLEAFFTF